MAKPFDDYVVRPDPHDPRLTERVRGIDHTGASIATGVVVERALTIFLNAQEIVTAMTINDYPEYLALGYLLNQNMLSPDDVVTGVDYDEELAVVVVRTERATDYEQKLKKKVQTSGCAPRGSIRSLTRSTRRRPSTSRRARSMAACSRTRTGRWSTWKTSAATTRSTRSPAGCSSTGCRRTTRSSTPPAASPPRW